MQVVTNFDSNYYKTKMKVAHGLYVTSDVSVSPPYARALREFYHSKMEHLEFGNADQSQTLGLINEYIDEVTGIHPMLEQPPEADWRLFIVDALSLHSRWLYPFDADDTIDKGHFFSPDNRR